MLYMQQNSVLQFKVSIDIPKSAPYPQTYDGSRIMIWDDIFVQWEMGIWSRGNIYSEMESPFLDQKYSYSYSKVVLHQCHFCPRYPIPGCAVNG